MKRYLLRIGSVLLAGALLSSLLTAAWAEEDEAADDVVSETEIVQAATPRNVNIYPCAYQDAEDEEDEPDAQSEDEDDAADGGSEEETAADDTVLSMRVNESVQLLAMSEVEEATEDRKLIDEEDVGLTSEEEDEDDSEDSSESRKASDDDEEEDEADEDSGEDADSEDVTYNEDGSIVGKVYASAPEEKFEWHLTDDSNGDVVSITDGGVITANEEGEATVIGSYTNDDGRTEIFRCSITVKGYAVGSMELYVPYDGNMESGMTESVEITLNDEALNAAETDEDAEDTGDETEDDDTADSEDGENDDEEELTEEEQAEREELLKSLEWSVTDADGNEVSDVLTIDKNGEDGSVTVTATDTFPENMDENYLEVYLHAKVPDPETDEEDADEDENEDEETEDNAETRQAAAGLEVRYRIRVWKAHLTGAQPDTDNMTISLDTDNMVILRVDESATLAVKAKPDNAYLGPVTWSTADDSIATVDAETGEITAVGAGTTTITATANKKLASEKSKKLNPVKYVFTVQVLPNSKVSSLTITDEDGNTVERKTLEVGAQYQLYASILPASAADTPITWSSSSAAIVSVNESGLLTAVRASTGTVTITATARAKDGERERSASCEIKVVEADSSTSDSTTTDDSTGTSGSGTTTSSSGGTVTTKTPTLTIPGTIVSIPRTTTSSSSTTTSGSTTTTGYVMPDNIPRAVYLTVDSSLDSATTSILTALDAFEGKATFFVPTDDLYASDDLLREIAGSGHSIGLLLQPEQAADIEDAITLLDDANSRLTVITGTLTRIVRIAGGSDAALDASDVEALETAGYRVWDWSTSANESSTAAATVYQNLVSAMNITGTVTIQFDGTANSATVLQQLLPYMQYAGIPSRAITAADNPVCQVTD